MRVPDSRRLVLGLAVLALLTAGTARPQIVPLVDHEAPGAWPELASLRWNLIARTLIRKNLVDPLWAARTFALLSVSQYDAVEAMQQASDDRDGQTVGVEAAAVATASATVLARVFPHEVPRISAELSTHQRELKRRVGQSALLDRAAEAGTSTASALLQRRENDGSTSLRTVDVPVGPGMWRSSETWPPLRPDWGEVQPFLIGQITDFDPLPPPPLSSTAFAEALDVVREARESQSWENESIAKEWADGPGTVTPTGHWNAIAARIIAHHGLGEAESARVLAFLNMALIDATILCWRTKFSYWLLRPTQADPGIVPSFPPPNFPSYPSGHAAISAAAATFLAHAFPDEAEELNRLAEEAARSRVVSGIHYPFDSEIGRWQGGRVGNAAILAYKQRLPRSSKLDGK